MRPRCSILTGGFDFSGCGDCTSCPAFELTEMSNSEPSAIMLQGIFCMVWIIHVSIRMEKSRLLTVVTPAMFLGRRTEEYRLSDRQSTYASDCAVDSRGVLVRTNDCFQHFRRRTC